MISFHQLSITPLLTNRRLLCRPVRDAHRHAIKAVKVSAKEHWHITLGDTLLFDEAGLKAIADAVQNYTGDANELRFQLILSANAFRDYYSHHAPTEEGRILLPIQATRKQVNGTLTSEQINIRLPEIETQIDFPTSLTPPDCNHTPAALLMPYSCSHDLLFANQIAIFSQLAAQVKRSPLSWLRGLFSRGPGSLGKRASISWKKIHPGAYVHPTAVIEGSIIGAGCRIGAHCVVRYSILGEKVHLHDGAKVEYSVVDNHSWLMHDLVLYRSLVEDNVFLIHGPYQFSYFQRQSAAFACIMMDYRPDDRDIRISTPSGLRHYKGRFLGALLEEHARVLGGTLTTPGITIPAGAEVAAPVSSITRAKDLLIDQTIGGKHN